MLWLNLDAVCQRNVTSLVRLNSPLSPCADKLFNPLIVFDYLSRCTRRLGKFRQHLATVLTLECRIACQKAGQCREHSAAIWRRLADRVLLRYAAIARYLAFVHVVDLFAV